MPLKKTVEGVSESDLAALVSSGARNARVMELKSDLPRATDAGKTEFLFDLSSFANSLGGYIVYGVTSHDDQSLEFTGLDESAVRESIGWMEQAAWSGINPRLPGLRMQVIELKTKKVALLLQVPKTLAGPHMVSFRHAQKFYSRNLSGKYLLEVDELRAAFSMGESLREKMRAFRMERIETLSRRMQQAKAGESPWLVMHVLPVNSFRPGFRVDLTRAVGAEGEVAWPAEARALKSYYNYDGLVTVSSMERYARSSVQVFRNGCVEATESLLLQEMREGRKYLSSVPFEREVIECGNRLLKLLRQLELEPPHVIMISLIGVRGYSMFVSSMRWQSNAFQIERDNLFLDEVVLEDATHELSRALRPALDHVWNACGWPRSLNYDAQGNWREHVS